MRPPSRLSVATKLEGAPEWSPESMMTTGIRALSASSTGATSARLSSGASTMPLTSRPMKFSTTCTCCSRSSSRSGPFQISRTFTPAAFSSRSAWRAPA